MRHRTRQGEKNEELILEDRQVTVYFLTKALGLVNIRITCVLKERKKKSGYRCFLGRSHFSVNKNVQKYSQNFFAYTKGMRKRFHVNNEATAQLRTGFLPNFKTEEDDNKGQFYTFKVIDGWRLTY